PPSGCSHRVLVSSVAPHPACLIESSFGVPPILHLPVLERRIYSHLNIGTAQRDAERKDRCRILDQDSTSISLSRMDGLDYDCNAASLGQTTLLSTKEIVLSPSKPRSCTPRPTRNFMHLPAFLQRLQNADHDWFRNPQRCRNIPLWDRAGPSAAAFLDVLNVLQNCCRICC